MNQGAQRRAIPHNRTKTNQGPGAEHDLAEELRQLRAAFEEQQTLLAQQCETLAALRQDHAQQQTEIDALRQQVATTPAARDAVETQSGITQADEDASVSAAHSTQLAGDAHGTSRRSLLKWGGAAAAAATVALVASEGQAAHAAPAANGGPLLIGTANTGTNQTGLAISGTSTASPFFQVDASASTGSGSPGPIAIGGLANIASNISAVGVYGSSTDGFGVYGISGSGPGVYGASTDNFAVEGQSTNSFGVFGSSTNADAVHGEADNGYGVFGFSFNTGVHGEGFMSGIGVAGLSGTGVDLSAVGTGRLQQNLQASSGAPTGGPYAAGEQVRDLNGELWICISGGSPGNWVRAAHAVFGYTGGATSYLSHPIRLLDTRGSDPNALHNGGGPYTSGGSPYSLVVAGVNWMSVLVPNNAVGAIGKLTVISGPGGSGFVALVPSGSGSPTTGTLPYGDSQTVATGFNVGLGGSPGALDIYIGGTAVQVVIDLFAVVA